MPEQPVYNPNNIIRKESVNSNIPTYNPNNIVKKEVVDTREFNRDINVKMPEYTTPKDLEVESAINFIKEQGGRNKSTLLDSELDVLRDVLKDSRATQEQKKKAILTIQGYDPKHDDSNTMYYNKLEDNGVYVPTALAYGEKPPKGYKVASVWGNQKEAEDDSWYTDLGKSLANGVLGAAQGAVDLAQVGTTMVTGEESKYLNKLSNTAETLKFKKDSELETPILNTEGVEKWTDLLDKDRFNLNAKSLWGAFNMAAESLVGFAGGAKGAATIAKGGKGFVQGLKGVGKEFIDEFGNVQNAITLGENATKATIFAGSFANQVGSVYESAKDAGLKGRDAAGFATAVAAPMAALDAFWGLDGKVMSELFYNQKKTLLKNVVKAVEKDAAGNITENGFKQLTKEMTIGYSELAKKGVKEVVKDAVSEGTQEAAQDFTQKAGEQLWDKLTPDERGQFGTNAFNAKSFGDYINSFATSLIPGGGMSIGTQILRSKHDEQSINAYERVKQGPEAIKALKGDLDTALKNGDITTAEHEQALFKIDAYNKYNEETKSVNLKPEDEKKAFELSFQIQGLKTEIPTNENEISKLDPIARAKVESKQKQAKELQSELNDIIRRGEIKGEPVVPKKEEERIQKEKEKEIKAEESLKKEETDANLQQKEVEKKQPKVQVKKEKSQYVPIHSTLDKRQYEDVSTEEFNEKKFPTRTKQRMARKFIYKQPNHKVDAKMTMHSYVYDGEVLYTFRGTMPDGKQLQFASSKMRPEGFRGHTRTERLKGNAEGLPITFKAVNLGEVPADYKDKMPADYKSNKIAIMIHQKSDGKFLGWAKETHKGAADALDKNGNPLYSEAEKDLMAHLETIDESPASEQEMEEARKPRPTPVERAATATEKIVEESKVKVKEQKASVPLTITKQVRQQLYDLGFSKANVDLMKPERANEIINKQETKQKEDVVKSKLDEYKKTLGLKIKRKVEGYNRLSFKEKKSEFGINLRSEIQKEVYEFGGSLKPLNRNNIQLLDNEGKQVKKESVKREQSVIDNEKAIAIKKKNALNTTPTSIRQYLAIVIGSKGQFDKSITKEIPNVPSMMKDFERGYTLESLLQGYKDRANLSDDAINESDFNTEAMDFLKEYLIEGGRDLAIKYATLSYEREINGGYTDKEISELEDYAKANNVTDSELSDIKDVAQNVNEEQYNEITEKIESKNENERNEQLADEITTDYFGNENEINDVFIKNESKKSGEEKDIIRNEFKDEQFQKESNKPSVYSQKVIDKLQKALPKVKILFDANLKAAGKWSPSTNTITINPEYAGKDTAIHEAGHILIDAMGYDNKIIQQAIKQLRSTDLYTETKQRYPELNKEQLDKEVLAEAIGREGADIFDKVADKSKFMTYLDYIFNWLKQKLGLDKNVAKSLAKQIIGGIKTKELKGTAGEEQLQKEKPKKKNPIGVKPLTFAQYAVEHGFSYEAETNKMEEALVNLQEATEEMEAARLDAENAETDKDAEVAEKVLAEKEAAYKEARKAYAIAGKKTFEYKQYKKDFNAIQEILKQKDLSNYSVEELQDLITRVHGFDNKAAKAVKEEAMLKLAFLVRKEIQAIHSKRDNYIESVADSKDITPLQKMLLHISHFTEYQPEMQKLSLEFGKAVMDKISDASTRKGVHEKLAQKVIAEENKKLGITGAALTRFSSDSAKYFEWMANEDGNLLTVEEAQKKGLSEAKINYLKFTRETIADYKEDMSKDNFENVVMEAIKVDKGFQEAFKSEGLLEAFSYYLGGGGYNLGKVRIEHNGTIKSYAEIEKEILSKTDKKSITSILSGLWELLKANVKARRQLKKGYNVDESVNPLEIKGDAEYSLNNKGQLVSKFDKPRSKDRGYSKDFYRAMNQFIDESAHVKHMSKIMPLVESVEYLNKKGYIEKGIQPKKNVAKWIEAWKALHIFKEPHVNDPVLDASIKLMRKLVASTTMWFNVPANAINVFVGNYNNWRAENAETLAKGNARLFGGKGERGGYGVVNKYALDIIKKYNIVNQDYDSQPTLRANNIFAKMANIGTQLGEYQIQGSLALGLLNEDEFNSFEFTKDKYGNDVLTVKPDGKYTEDEIKAKMTQIKNRVTDIQGKYPDEDRRNIMRGEFGKALFQFKVWMPDWFKERFGARYINAYGQEKEGSYTKMLRIGIKEMAADLKKGDIKKALTNPAFVTNLKGMITIGALLALKNSGDDEEKKKGGLNWDNMLSQVLFIFDLEQDKYMVSNPAAVLGKLKDLLNAFEALVGFEEDAWEKTKRVLPANKAITFAENQLK